MWFQLQAENLGRAWDFYGQAFGWSREGVYADEKPLGAVSEDIAPQLDTAAPATAPIQLTDGLTECGALHPTGRPARG
jgi:hypothetical protein